MDEVAPECFNALVFFHVVSGAIWDEFVGKAIINKVHLWSAIRKDVDHDIFELQVVVGSMRGVQNPENVDKLLRYGEKLSWYWQSSKVLKVLLQIVAVFRYDVISAYYDSILSEIL